MPHREDICGIIVVACQGLFAMVCYDKFLFIQSSVESSLE